jgi:uracil-DNA glycosylase
MEKKAKEIKVKKIIIAIGDKELSLSLEDAKALKKALGDILRESDTTVWVYPSYSPSWTYTSTPKDPIPQYPIITCTTSNTTGIITLPGDGNSSIL